MEKEDEPEEEEDESQDEEEEEEDDDDANSEDGDDEGSPDGDVNSQDKETSQWKGHSSETERKSDVGEGKTLFIRNLDFATTQDSLKNFMEQFGSVQYALLCMDKIMERPKGTGFVKFRVSLNKILVCFLIS